VRFGQEVAGAMELGMSHRGEHAEIETFLGETVDSELSGNMIDLCPVGALTSKPFRYSARTWEMSRRKSVSPHDSTGANLIVQVKNNAVMRVVPLENEAINECWIADRDRFSYEALNSEQRLDRPMLKQGGVWQEVDWQTALEYVANGLSRLVSEHGASAIGALVSPHSTLEELYLAAQLVRGLGSDNIDHRLRHAEFANDAGVHWLGTSIASLSTLQSALIVGSNLRKDHPLFAQRIRQASRHGCAVSAVTSAALLKRPDAWALPVNAMLGTPSQWLDLLAGVATAIAEVKGVVSPLAGTVTEASRLAAQSLMAGERKAVLLGNAAAHHAQGSSILALAGWIAAETGATVGYLTEAANTVGAQWVQAHPVQGGAHAAAILGGAVKGVLLLGVEPGVDTAKDVKGLASCDMVVTLSPFKTNLDISDVLLPVAPFTETSGSFVNAEGVCQSFHAVVRPRGETRPAWKVLRVLGSLLKLPGFDFETSQDVLAKARAKPLQLDNRSSGPVQSPHVVPDPVVASIYQLDGLVRRAPALQATADAREEASA